jgi:Protein of unknown function (DUF3179)
VRGRTFVFGSSGFLFRSNKLMYDQQTKSLWQHMRGEPVIGPLADSGIRLIPRPVVTTTWGEWVRMHPRTTVLDVATGYARDYTPGRPYGAYYASPDTMFPVFPRDGRLATKDIVFVLRLDPARKVYPLAAFDREPIVHDALGGTSVVLLGRSASRTVRAYERGGLVFRAGRGSEELVAEGTGDIWRVTEDALVAATSGRRLPRVAGHLAYWFGWFAFHPDTPIHGR